MNDRLSEDLPSGGPGSRFLQRLERLLRPFAEGLVAFAKYDEFIVSVDATGWLLYHTVPVNWIDEFEEDTCSLENRLSDFYQTQWSAVRQDIESRLSDYHISEQSKETFREALSAHDYGFYRCVCSVLFPAIDREWRIQFFQDSAGNISSKRMLDKFTKARCLEDFFTKESHGWMLFDRLAFHLFIDVDDSNRSTIAQDFVPTRHASVHGLVDYSEFKHSVNMIIMTDYIFQLLTKLSKLSDSSQS